MTEVKLLEVEINKISLKPGDVLLVKVDGPDFADPDTCDALQASLKKVFPNNDIGVLYMQGNTIDLSVISQETAVALEKVSNGEEKACNTTNYCDNCSCGKKELAEG